MIPRRQESPTPTPEASNCGALICGQPGADIEGEEPQLIKIGPVDAQKHRIRSRARDLSVSRGDNGRLILEADRLELLTQERKAVDRPVV